MSYKIKGILWSSPLIILIIYLCGHIIYKWPVVIILGAITLAFSYCMANAFINFMLWASSGDFWKGRDRNNL